MNLRKGFHLESTQDYVILLYMATLSPQGLENIRQSKIGNKNPQYIKGKDTYRTYKWLYRKYILEDLSLSAISKIAGVSSSCLVKWMNKVEIERRNFCGRSGIKSGKWKGGKITSKAGYVYIHKPDHPRCYRKYVPEHILIAEKVLGRYLNGDEVVHHINEKKGDNRPKNLYLFKNEKEHQRYHQKFRKGTIKRIYISNLSKSS